jgi:hypothetical protein
MTRVDAAYLPLAQWRKVTTPGLALQLPQLMVTTVTGIVLPTSKYISLFKVLTMR